jgi:hypothetical protein
VKVTLIGILVASRSVTTTGTVSEPVAVPLYWSTEPIMVAVPLSIVAVPIV